MKYNFNTPKFWRKKNSIISFLLLPISLLYRLISRIRYAIQTPKKVSVPVICIGNATVGGSGKTPFAIALGKLLKKHKYKIAFACKNYNGSIKEPKKVTKQDSTSEVIDEAFLLSEIAPTYVAQNRLDAIKLAAKDKPDIIIADDGLQNNSFYKNLSILVIDRNLHINNKAVFPAGPFREKPIHSVKKSDVVCYIDPKGKLTKCSDKYISAKTSYKLIHTNTDYIPFTGIAFPEKFFNSFKNLGITLHHKTTFPDHYKYEDRDIEKLIKKSKETNIPLITTTKDIVRIPSKYKHFIDVLEINITIQDQDKLLQKIKDTCKKY